MWKTRAVARWKTIVRGDRFGLWLVASTCLEGIVCQCACGLERAFDSNAINTLLFNRSKGCWSCRALERHKTGMAPVYRAIIPDPKLLRQWHSRYQGIVGRCTNKDSTRYADYGGRGIRVGESFNTAEKFLRYIVTIPGVESTGYPD